MTDVTVENEKAWGNIPNSLLLGFNNNNNNNQDDIYSAVIMTRSLREFTRFIW